MATLEEALAAATVDDLVTPVNDIFLINPETRMITVPETEKLFGARQDMDAERKYFRCPRIVGDNIDLSQHRIYVSYVPSKQDGTYSATEEVGSYLCEDLAVDGEYVTFSWRLSGNVFQKAGYIAFAIYAKQVDADGNLKTKWHTAIAVGNVLDTLPDGSQVLEKYPDVMGMILSRLDKLEEGGSGGTGDAGASAYEIAVKNGFTGTEAEWLASLKGEPGEPGTDGDPGQDGKSAYQYAQDGGYTGSEEEFAAKLAKEYADLIEKVSMTAADTTAEIQPNKLYVFPEMNDLTLTFAAPTDTTIANEYHVIFQSGATATTLIIPDTIRIPDGFSVEANKVYELSVLEGCLSYMSWDVTAEVTA